jgi:alpha-2-macroglobulin
MAAEAAPRGPLDVAVKVEGVAAGETAYVTIAAVDVGILNLTGFEAPTRKAITSASGGWASASATSMAA